MQIDNQPIKVRNGEMKERHASRNAHAKPTCCTTSLTSTRLAR